MIDLNGDGQIDPTEIVLSGIIMENDDTQAERTEQSAGESKPAWLGKLFRARREDNGK